MLRNCSRTDQGENFCFSANETPAVIHNWFLDVCLPANIEHKQLQSVSYFPSVRWRAVNASDEIKASQSLKLEQPHHQLSCTRLYA